MTLGVIGWAVLGTMASVVVIAFVISWMVCPPKLFDPPPEPAPPKPQPPKKGAVDLEEYREGHWK